jgi:hypothetical protein
MKRTYWILSIIGILIVGIVVGVQGHFIGNVPVQQPSSGLPREYAPTAEVERVVESTKVPEAIARSIVINFGNGQKMAGTVQARTAFEALETFTHDRHIPIKTKQYQFGVMVEAVGDQVNKGDLGWMYRVNGKVGQIAADRYNLTPRDQVEWTYGK